MKDCDEVEMMREIEMLQLKERTFETSKSLTCPFFKILMDKVKMDFELFSEVENDK